MPTRELEGKVAIVTGGSRGIGAATAKELSKQGARGIVLASTGKNEQAVNDVAHQVELNGAKALIFSGDLRNPEIPERIVAATKQEFGGVNIVVNNAGITRDNDLLRMSLEEWNEVVEVDLRPAFFLSRYAFRAFPRDPQDRSKLDGSIVNVSSIMGLVGNSGQENYAAAKAGLIGVTMSLARNMGRRGVRVNAVAPGFIDTDMTQAMDPRFRDDILAAIISLTPLDRLGTTQDVADAITFLAGPRASFITGQTLAVDGGLGGSLHAIPKVIELQREIRKLKGQVT